ncbi:hypothetical protein BJ875DRAFT_270421 [Amylocarpus encephaloides]|uniref:RanBD1 domain-containing protein n=1 Tax=Amylocarpus encephaloides TaxID=45428 RepID=A0A9P7YM01_9HELO|nr:hypothetical protein BJ875DRAFT_270421 [Amylocarpus encephaloides]
MVKPSTSSSITTSSSSSNVPPKQNALSVVAPKTASGRSPLWNNAPYSTPKPYTPAVSSRLVHVENAEGPGIEKDDDAPEEPAHSPSFLNSSGENQFVNHEGNPEDYPELFPGMTYASRYPIEKMAGFVPTHFTPDQRVEFYTGYRMRVLNKAMQRYFGTVQISDNIFPAMRYYNSLREVIVQRTSEDLTQELGKLKRKGVEGRDAHAEPSSRRQKLAETASLFQRPSNESGPSQPLSIGEKASIPPTPPQSQKLLPPSNPMATALPSKGKRKGDDLTKGDWENSGSSTALKRARMQNASESIGSGSNTSTLFKNALKSPAKDLPKQSTEGDNGPPKANPFAILPASTSTTPTASPSRPLASASASGSFTPKIDGPPFNSQTSFGGFTPSKVNAPVLTSNGASAAIQPPVVASAPASGFTLKSPSAAPPKFGTGPVNFLAQFSANAEATEKKEMQKAKDEDMDSDDDEVEWEANWKKKRAAHKKELDDLAKSKQPMFVPGRGFSLGRIEKPSDSTSSEKVNESSAEGTKSPFGQNPAPKSSGTSVFSSINGSRSPTPSPFSGTGGSVLDTHTSGQPVTFGGNIFGHLSDADSGASGKNSAVDEDSDDGTEGESDSENKDPSFKPGKENQSGQSTPAEDTGAGIASAKKPQATPFTFLGTTPKNPSGLFADADGNPIRELPTSSEEKENTQPSSTNVFGEAKNPFASLNRPAGMSSDQTWKHDSPIKFGTATPGSEAKSDAPTVTVQAATPTKPPPSFGNLFGITNDPKSSASPPISNLFGGLKGSSTGFGFGATSGSSSLFPSAAASVTTSRATTPGATSDGDSVAEGDPDGVRHEQIDLTAGGRGEENEDILHQVRARAMKYNANEAKWDVKGLGPLKILKDKDTNAVRIVLRADPSGKIILNKAVLSQTYQATQKTVKLLTAADVGSDLETWILQVKAPDLAERLVKVLEENKPS